MKSWTLSIIGLLLLGVILSVGTSACWDWSRTDVARAPGPASGAGTPLHVPPVSAQPSSWAVLPRPTDTPAPISTPTPELATIEKIWAAQPLPARDLFALAQRLHTVGGGLRRVINPEPPVYQVGDRATFWVAEEAGKTYFEITASLRYISDHAAWWVQEGVEVNMGGLKRAAAMFETQTYPTNRRYFGQEWSPGIDNDPRIQIVNGRLSPGIGGYYSSADEYPNAINPHSNQREIIYINLDAYHPGNRRYDAVLAHEFQHMIHWHSDPNESTWVDEGAAELAVQLNGYADDRWAPAFARQPDTQLNAWTEEPGQAGVHYGASYLFMRYFAERFGPERVQALVASDDSDIAGFDAVLAESGLSFDDVFRDWAVANYLDDPSLNEGRYGYQGADVHARVTKMLGVGETWTDTVHQYGTDYLKLEPGSGPITIQFNGITTIPVIDAQPHSGKYFFWSNRGDGSVTSLTRAFDLTGVESATLKAWLWYDIEPYFDFAYVEISADGGEAWRIVAGQHTTMENPTGNGLGPGYTGHSDGRNKPGWIEETIDLTPFAGYEILVRWEQITDDGYNAPGLAIDDVAIPEIGYYEDFESGDGGWIGEGFVRIDNLLPQRWTLQLIHPDSTPVVTHIPVKDGQARFQVTDDAVLAISAMTPFTTEPAKYTLTVKRLR